METGSVTGSTTTVCEVVMFFREFMWLQSFLCKVWNDIFEHSPTSGTYSQRPVLVWGSHTEGLTHSGEVVWKVLGMDTILHIFKDIVFQDALLSLGLTNPNLFVSWLFHDSDQVRMVWSNILHFHFWTVLIRQSKPALISPIRPSWLGPWQRLTQAVITRWDHCTSQGSLSHH